MAQPPTMSQNTITKIMNKICNGMYEDNITEPFINELMSTKSPDACVKLAYKKLERYQLMPKNLQVAKYDDLAKNYIAEGDKLFANENFREAMQNFNYAIKFATTSRIISIGYARRSAALYHLKKYRESLLDIERAIEKGYDEKHVPQLLLRRKLCEKALELTLAKEVAAEIQKEMLRQEFISPPVNRMSGVTGILGASASLKISHSKSVGRCIVATEDIQPGQVLVVEDPYMSTLHKNYFNFRCNYCSKFNFAMIPCKTCVHVMYCNEECRDKSWKLGHQFECSIIGDLTSMNIGSLGILNIRMLVKARYQHSSWEKFFETIQSIEKQTDCEPKLKGFTKDSSDSLSYNIDHYATVYTLETNIEKWNEGEFFGANVISALILYMLKEYTTLFEDCHDVSFNNLTSEDVFWKIGGLLLRHCLSLMTNSFSTSAYFESRQLDIAAIPFAHGLYLFSSLFSHSCYPNTNYIFHGTTIKILANRLIKKGQEVFVGYGKNYYSSTLTERRFALMKSHKFLCKCEACINDWPLSSELPEARLISTKYNHLLNDISIDSLVINFYKDNCQISKEILKSAYKFVTMLQEGAPFKELHSLQEFILINWFSLGNLELSERKIADDNDDDLEIEAMNYIQNLKIN